MMSRRRDRMVEEQLHRRGIRDARVLEAFRRVPREAFVPEDMVDLAYRDAPLPIGGGQTISQPYVVALTAQALQLRGGERILEVGAGSGYAAAILGQIAGEVYAVERLAELADAARERLARLAYPNVHIVHGDGTLGLPEHAPYDAIAVAAGGPSLPKVLLEQLAIGGRLVMPIGPEEQQILVRTTRVGTDEYREEPLTEVRFVPLIGEHGWPEPGTVARAPRPSTAAGTVAALVSEAAEDVDEIDALIERIGSARLVLMGEASHGTSEFYRHRARLSRALIERKGFDFVAVEADWPDAARIDAYVLGDQRPSRVEFTPFSRFPTWMWRNREVFEFVAWLRQHNAASERPDDRIGFHGLDLYSLYTSIDAVIEYLHGVDPDAESLARARYGSLTPWQHEPAEYGRAVLSGRAQSSEAAVVAMLRELLERRLDYSQRDGDRFFDAAQNARVVANAERYYRAMYHGSVASWNLRDTHMFDTLTALFDLYGAGSKGIVWEHNSHIGNAMATEMGRHGQINVGQLARSQFGDGAYLIGYGTHEGTVAAASQWGDPMQIMRVRPSLPDSYERLFHDSGRPAFQLHLRAPHRRELRDELLESRLERAIGVIYRPDSERLSHYFMASLPHQFDELVWFDRSEAIEALPPPERIESGLPETYPFGL